MPRDHEGALSGVTYTIPELDDRRNIEVAFEDFADTLPPFPDVPPVLRVTALTGPVVTEANTVYVSEGSAPITVTLPTTATQGDRVLIAQVGTGIITIAGIGAGVPVTAGINTAVTAIWDGAKWVGLPFSFSGTRPTESTGGTQPPVDLNGFRYHLFTIPGTYTFISHKDLAVEAYVAGGGVDGSAGSTTAAGVAGMGGEVLNDPTIAIEDWTFTTVVVGARGAGSRLNGVSAAGGAAGVSRPPTVLSGDWATVIGETLLGGPGPATGVDADTYGKGGGAGIQVLPSYPQGSESYSYSTGGPFTYDCSYGARREDYVSGQQEIIGDPPVPPTWQGACPGGWWNALTAYGQRCVTSVPIYSTRWHCDSGGSLNGSTCQRTCNGDSTQWHTGTRPIPCGGGYVLSGSACVDPRSPAGGKGGGGLVALRYAHP